MIVYIQVNLRHCNAALQNDKIFPSFACSGHISVKIIRINGFGVLGATFYPCTQRQHIGGACGGWNGHHLCIKAGTI